MLESSKICELYDAPQAPPARIWEAVRVAEGAERMMMAVPQACGIGPFALRDYLHTHGTPSAVLDGSLADATQHRHAYLFEPAKSVLSTLEKDAKRPLECGNEIAEKHVRLEVENGRIEFEYASTAFRVYIFTYVQPNAGLQKLNIVTWSHAHPTTSDDPLLAGKRLVADVYAWSSQLHEEMWVYNGVAGGWRKDKGFYRAVHASDPDELVLPQDTLDQLYRDTTTFFESQALFQELNLTWKRGILLLGPPGNGKTGVIKVLAKRCTESLGVPSLYVQTAKSRAGPEYGMTAIFQKARQEAPCVLILEDIETLVSGDMRTVMLNQLDGIESNDGILVIATANDASKLDPAILQRPSRFDAKYAFDLPDAGLRGRFVRRWLIDKIGMHRLTFDDGHSTTADVDALVAEVVRQTENWSFAFLKELFISFLLEQTSKASIRATAKQAGAHFQLEVRELLEHVKLLQKQVLSVHAAEANGNA